MEHRNPLEVFWGGVFIKETQSLKVDGSSVILTKKNRQTVIPIRSIKKFTLSLPGRIVTGSLTITTSESFGRAPLVFVFRDKGELEYAQNIQKYIENFQASSNTSPETPPQISVADELVKLKALVDDGILTPEEFEAKKKQLLNL